MSKKSFAELQSISNDRELTKEQDPDFWKVLQCGLVMALREQGEINEMQLRSVMERLKNGRSLF